MRKLLALLTRKRLLLRTLLLTAALVHTNAAHAQTPSYQLAYSMQASRAAGVPLNGAAVNGVVYIFTATAADPTNFRPTGIAQVSYWIDNTAATGAPFHIEHSVPYDLQSNGDIATGWNAAGLATGAHTLTQVVTLSSGATDKDTASFMVTTPPPPPTAPVTLVVNPGSSALFDDGKPIMPSSTASVTELENGIWTSVGTVTSDASGLLTGSLKVDPSFVSNGSVWLSLNLMGIPAPGSEGIDPRMLQQGATGITLRVVIFKAVLLPKSVSLALTP